MVRSNASCFSRRSCVSVSVSPGGNGQEAIGLKYCVTRWAFNLEWADI